MAELGKNPFAQSTKSKFTGFPTAVGKNPFVQQPQKALTEEEALQQATMAGGKTIPGKVAKFGLDLVGSILNPFAKASVGPALEYTGLVEPKKLQNVPLLGNIRPPQTIKEGIGSAGEVALLGLVPGGAAPAKTLLRTVGKRTAGGAALGAGFGASAALKENADIGETLKAAGFGAAVGAPLGLATGALQVKGIKKAEKQQEQLKKLIKELEKPDFEVTLSGKTGLDLQKARNSLKRVDTLTNRANTVEKEIKDLRKQLIKQGANKKAINGKIQTRQNRLAEIESEIGLVQQLPEYKLLSKAKEEGFEDMLNKIVTPRGVKIDLELATKLKGLRDISSREAGGVLTATDPLRVAEKLDKSLRGDVKRIFIEPVVKERTNMLVNKEQITKQFADLLEKANLQRPGIVKRLLGGGKDQLEKNARIFRYAEGRASKADLAALSKDEKAVANFVRNQYDDLLTRINKSRKTNNLDPIKKRKDYVTHLQELNFWSKTRDVTAVPSKELEFIQRTDPKFNFAKERLGGDFEEDIITAFEAYLDPALKQIYLTTPGNTVKAYAEFLPPNARKYFTDWANEALFGVADPITRFVTNNVSPKLVNMAQRLTSRTARGAIVGNLNVLALQPSTIASTATTATHRQALKGLNESLTKAGEKFAFDNSKWYRTRIMELDINPKELMKVEKVANYLNKRVDSFMVKHSFLSNYNYAKTQLNLSDKAAIRYADEITGKNQAIYDAVFTPRTLRSPVGRLFTQFQTFSYNLWNQLIRDPKIIAQIRKNPSQVKEMLKLYGNMLAVNTLYKGAGLREPFELPGVKMTDEGAKLTPGQIVPVLSGSVRFGPAIVPSIVWDSMKIAFGDERDRAQGIAGLKSTAPSLVPMGNQISKTVRGAKAVSEGKTEIGTKKLPIEGIPEQLRALIFGPYGTKEAQKYFEARE